MGYLNFDENRYWYVREPDKWYFEVKDWESNHLPSDASRRVDVTTFRTKTIELAQEKKDLIEQQKEKDIELRNSAIEKRNLN